MFEWTEESKKEIYGIRGNDDHNDYVGHKYAGNDDNDYAGNDDNYDAGNNNDDDVYVDVRDDNESSDEDMIVVMMLIVVMRILKMIVKI